jgi:23S rRNA (adenine1618-N6)-methyltransferase
MSSVTASLLHPRNRHQGRYDFERLIQDSPSLSRYVRPNPHGDQSIDFANPAAVKELNRALLKSFYGITSWDIPKDYLCPPIPGRADYIHYLADLLASDNGGVVPQGPSIGVMDVGTGANIIYPLIGHAEYGWRFLGSDIDRTAIASARAIVLANPSLGSNIELRLQASPEHIFSGVLTANDDITLTMCNPPFHASPGDALRSAERKWRGLGRANPAAKATVRNFGGNSTELWCPGGESAFVRRLIHESADIGRQVRWFSTLVSKESNLSEVFHFLRKVQARDVRTVEMAQGQKRSRFVAWTFI